MKPPSVMYRGTGNQRQKIMKILTCNYMTYGGSPARHVDSSCEAGNKKSSCRDGEYNILIFNRLI
jgi:hypothetical protein